MDDTPELPEFASVENFVEFLVDVEDRTEFTFEEASRVAKAIGHSVATYVIRDLKGYGLTMAPRVPERHVRGFRSNSHDRWSGPGSCKTHGGSGWEQISGFAGQRG